MGLAVVPVDKARSPKARSGKKRGMAEVSPTRDLWEDAANLYEQIVDDGGDPEIDPAFALNERTLETVRTIVWKRERSS